MDSGPVIFNGPNIRLRQATISSATIYYQSATAGTLTLSNVMSSGDVRFVCNGAANTIALPPGGGSGSSVSGYFDGNSTSGQFDLTGTRFGTVTAGNSAELLGSPATIATTLNLETATLRSEFVQVTNLALSTSSCSA